MIGWAYRTKLSFSRASRSRLCQPTLDLVCSCQSPSEAYMHQRSRPSSFARYMARSARERRSPAVVAWSGKHATPMLAVIRNGEPPATNVWFRIAASRSPATDSACSTPVCGRRTANSSPPRRAATSVSRNRSRRRRASEERSSSPAWCPRLSFTSLNWSRSMKRSTPWTPYRCASERWRSTSSSNRRRLNSPVSGSWFATCTSCDSNRLRSLMSLIVPANPMAAPLASRRTCAETDDAMIRPSASFSWIS